MAIDISKLHVDSKSAKTMKWCNLEACIYSKDGACTTESRSIYNNQITRKGSPVMICLTASLKE